MFNGPPPQVISVTLFKLLDVKGFFCCFVFFYHGKWLKDLIDELLI